MDEKMEDLLPLVSALAHRYTRGESTSVSYETAQSLMEAVLYCLEEYRHSSLAPAPKEISVKEQYQTGLRLVLEKTDRIRHNFNTLSPIFEDYGVKCLSDTVQKGIPAFLKWYDATFRPQDTLLTLDYPLLSDHSSMKGADAVDFYLDAIRTEQHFLNFFGTNCVTQILRQYTPTYEDMYENICDLVLQNAIGHIALRKPYGSVGFQREDHDLLSEIFGPESVSATEHMVIRFTKALVGQFYDSDPGLLSYLCCDARNIAVRIHTAVQNGQLHVIFPLDEDVGSTLLPF